MKTITIINKLETIQQEANNVLLAKLIDELKHEVYQEEYKFNSTMKKQYNACMKILKRNDYTKESTTRPILGISDKQRFSDGEEYTILTDSYILIALKENLGLPTKEDFYRYHKDSNVNYPNCYSIVPSIEDMTKVDNSFIMDTLKGLKAKTLEKLNKIYIGKFSLNNNEVCFNANYLKSACECLGSTNLDVYTINNTRLFIVKNRDTQSFAVILPIVL